MARKFSEILKRAVEEAKKPTRAQVRLYGAAAKLADEAEAALDRPEPPGLPLQVALKEFRAAWDEEIANG